MSVCQISSKSDYQAELRHLSIFTALHAMPAIAARKLSVRPSVKCVICDKTKERSIFIPYERAFSYICFLANIMVYGGRSHLPEIMGQADPVGAKSPIFS